MRAVVILRAVTRNCPCKPGWVHLTLPYHTNFDIFVRLTNFRKFPVPVVLTAELKKKAHSIRLSGNNRRPSRLYGFAPLLGGYARAAARPAPSSMAESSCSCPARACLIMAIGPGGIAKTNSTISPTSSAVTMAHSLCTRACQIPLGKSHARHTTSAVGRSRSHQQQPRKPPAACLAQIAVAQDVQRCLPKSSSQQQRSPSTIRAYVERQLAPHAHDLEVSVRQIR